MPQESTGLINKDGISKARIHLTLVKPQYLIKNSMIAVLILIQPRESSFNVLLSKRLSWFFLGFFTHEYPHEKTILKDMGSICFSFVKPKYITSNIVVLLSLEK